MDFGIWVSQEAFQRFTSRTQEELIAHLQGLKPAPRSALKAPVVQPEGDEDLNDQPADFSLAQIKKLLVGCGEKTKSALKLIAEQSENNFQLNDLAGAMKLDPMGLRGVWGGITKRTHTVLGDDEANFIIWEQLADGWRGHLSVMTYKNLRKAMGL